jgi:hypothetical protein
MRRSKYRETLAIEMKGDIAIHLVPIVISFAIYPKITRFEVNAIVFACKR